MGDQERGVRADEPSRAQEQDTDAEPQNDLRQRALRRRALERRSEAGDTADQRAPDAANEDTRPDSGVEADYRDPTPKPDLGGDITVVGPTPPFKTDFDGRLAWSRWALAEMPKLNTGTLPINIKRDVLRDSTRSLARFNEAVAPRKEFCRRGAKLISEQIDFFNLMLPERVRTGMLTPAQEKDVRQLMADLSALRATLYRRDVPPSAVVSSVDEQPEIVFNATLSHSDNALGELMQARSKALGQP